MLENAQAAPDAEIVATRIVGVVALVDAMADAKEIAKGHVRLTVLLMAAQGCAVDVRAAATVILDALLDAELRVQVGAATATILAWQRVQVGVILRAADALGAVIRDALGAVIRDAQAAPGARAHALDVRHVEDAPDALPGAVEVVTTAAPDRVSYHAAETAHQRVSTPVLGRVPQSWQTN